mgnify:CR=1 FL=1
MTSNALNNKVDLSTLNTPNGIVGLDGNTKIPSYLLPSLSFTSVATASSNAEMIAVGATSSKGTVCIRTDLSKTYVLSIDYGGMLSDWIEMLTPGSPVQSVNGKTGTLNINTGDLSESGNLFFTNARSRSSISAATPIQYNAATGVMGADTSNSNTSLVSRWTLSQQNLTNTSNLALKVNISDTSNMLYPYVRNNNLTNQLNTKLNLTHTGIGSFPSTNPDFAITNFEEGWNYLIKTSLKEFLEKFTHTRVNVELASEFRYGNPILGKKDLAIFVSQSGETADTLAALRYARAGMRRGPRKPDSCRRCCCGTRT